MLASTTRWLTLTNILLGVVVAACVVVVGLGVLCELISGVRRRSLENELDRDIGELFGHAPGSVTAGSRRATLPRLCSCVKRAITVLRKFLQHSIHKARHQHGH